MSLQKNHLNFISARSSEDPILWKNTRSPPFYLGKHKEPTILLGKTQGAHQEPTILLGKTQGKNKEPTRCPPFYLEKHKEPNISPTGKYNNY